ncbi:MAG: hypothetical protein Q9220_001668 [cf. Caloplaca sp. 1 TL-2023]
MSTSQAEKAETDMQGRPPSLIVCDLHSVPYMRLQHGRVVLPSEIRKMFSKANRNLLQPKRGVIDEYMVESDNLIGALTAPLRDRGVFTVGGSIDDFLDQDHSQSLEEINRAGKDDSAGVPSWKSNVNGMGYVLNKFRHLLAPFTNRIIIALEQDYLDEGHTIQVENHHSSWGLAPFRPVDPLVQAREGAVKAVAHSWSAAEEQLDDEEPEEGLSAKGKGPPKKKGTGTKKKAASKGKEPAKKKEIVKGNSKGKGKDQPTEGTEGTGDDQEEVIE